MVDLFTGGRTISDARTHKEKVIELLDDTTFRLHKWHSDVDELKRDSEHVDTNVDRSFAQ